GARVLDVGCGAGATVAYLAELGLRAVGVDASAAMLRGGNGRFPPHPAACGRAALGRGERLPFAAARFDALLAECCLSLMDDAARALAEFARVLQPGGTLILSDMLAGNPAAVAAVRQLPLACCIRGAFSRPQLAALLADAGFEITFWEDNGEALKQLTVQIIWEYGSLANFWACAGGDAAAETAVGRMQPGYFLLLASKEGTQRTQRNAEDAKI
ncbi:MAG: class I SAM-dependent methyltransferase, partial [Anaerolineales bacterium]|nr:class I SAM-dependent methyltransferase [Anaerolineales bacterium]